MIEDLRKPINPLDPPARLISEALMDLGLDAEPKALAERVRQLQRGLPAEDEFALLLSWLGNCTLVHRLDQFQIPPESRSTYHVPDLLAVFKYKGREIPTIVEVKTSVKRTLSWRPDYYQAIRSYAKLLGLPLLLAWNWTEFGFWTLCDIDLFDKAEKNYHLTYEKAMKHSLLCELAGDFNYVFQPGVGLHFKFAKIQEVTSDSTEDNLWHVRIDEAYFTDSDGNRLNTLGPGLWWMFLGADQQTETDDHPEHMDHRFVMTEESPMQAAHRLLSLVTLGLSSERPVPWRQLMEKHSFAIGGRALNAEARSAIERKIVRYVFHQVPSAMPSFMS